MNKKVRWITETAVMLALLVSLQALTKGFGQFVTGSCVNAVLAVTVLTAGLGSGIVVAVLSPVLAYLLGIVILPARLSRRAGPPLFGERGLFKTFLERGGQHDYKAQSQYDDKRA